VPLHPDLIRDMCCPATRKPLELLGDAELASLNERILAGEIKNRSGEVVRDAVGDALRPQGEDYVYPVRDDIPSMRIDQALLLGSGSSSDEANTR
jgi:uncharacterized protein YbaR (Trm112 family)